MNDTTSATSHDNSNTQAVSAPVAKKIPHEMSIHNDTRIDDYYWMRDDSRTDPEIIAHLNAENSYTDAVMAHTTALQQTLFDELKGRIVKDDNTEIGRASCRERV